MSTAVVPDRYFLHESYPVQTPLGHYLLVVPTAAFIALDDVSLALVDALREGVTRSAGELEQALADRFDRPTVHQGLAELLSVEAAARTNGAPGAGAREGGAPGAIGTRLPIDYQPVDLDAIPVTSLTAHIAHDCNLRCTYCYADTGPYGAGRQAMTCTMARQYVDLLLERSGDAPRVTLIFFGGEPMLNYPTMVDAVGYGRARARELGKTMRFAMTTNGTMFDEEKFAFLVENDVGITVSMDGPPAAHDRFRIFADGRGSYEHIARTLPPLLRMAPVTCRVTLTRETMNVPELVDHFLGMGFHEVTIGSVGSPDPLMAIPGDELPALLEGFQICAGRYLNAVARGSYYGFGNLTNILRLIHEGHARSFGCGAGIQTFAGDPNGDLYMCHRLVGNDDYRVGHVERGIDAETRRARLDATHVRHKTDCQTCWARTLCAGSCFAQLENVHGDTRRTYEPLCDWIRGWLTSCLEAYALLMEQHPQFFEDVIEPRMA